MIEIIAGLETVCVKNPNSSTAIIMLHGYGANMHDLSPLNEVWHRPKIDWFFPNAPLNLPMGFFDGRAWFSIDLEELERSMREGTSRVLSYKVPLEFKNTMAVLKKFIQELERKYSTIIIGGFSQGAMCASHLACDEELNINGLIILSGNLLANDLFPKRTKSIPFFQSHGSYDQILSLSGAKELTNKLKELGLNGELLTFPGGHEIPPMVISKVNDFLSHLIH